MPDAIFRLEADIVPQIDERELQRQAQLLTRKLNGLLAGNLDKISPEIATGSFRPFQQEVEKTTSSMKNGLGRAVDGVKNGVGNLVKSGRMGFLKFTEAVKLTRVGLLGFNGSIRDAIKSNTAFEDSFQNMRNIGGIFDEISGAANSVFAQIDSGTSVLDRAAAAGNQLAQFLQPVAQAGSANVLQLQDMNEGFTALIKSASRTNEILTKLIPAGKGVGGALEDLADDSTLVDERINQVARSAIHLRDSFLKNDKLKDRTIVSSFAKELEEAAVSGDAQKLIDVLEATKVKAQKLTGPFGKIRELLHNITKEDREAAIQVEQGAIDHLRQLGVTTLGPLEKLNSKLRVVDTVLKNVKLAFDQSAFGQTTFGKSVSAFATQFNQAIKSTSAAAANSKIGQGILTQFFKAKKGITNFTKTTTSAITSNFKDLFGFIPKGIEKALFKSKKGVTDFVKDTTSAMKSNFKDVFGFGKAAGAPGGTPPTKKQRLPGDAGKIPKQRSIKDAIERSKVAAGALTAVPKPIQDIISKKPPVAKKPEPNVTIFGGKAVQAVATSIDETAARLATAGPVSGKLLLTRLGIGVTESLKAGSDSVKAAIAGMDAAARDAMGKKLGAKGPTDTLRAPSVVPTPIVKRALPGSSFKGPAKSVLPGDVGTAGESLIAGARATVMKGISAWGPPLNNRIATGIMKNIVSLGPDIIDATAGVGSAVKKSVSGNLKGRFGIGSTSEMPASIKAVAPTAKRTLPAVTASAGKAEAVSAGKDILAGLAVGMEKGIPALGPSIAKIKLSAIGELKKRFGIGSPAESTKPPGADVTRGFAVGISSAIGAVTKAVGLVVKATLLPFKLAAQAVSALTTSAMTFAKSAVTVVGVAFAGLAATSIHAGLEFNKLQQVVSGTLPVLVGSKVAAKGLLEEINLLNDSSPFARSSFLELTQTLAGFGVEAEKITPLIDAIQQTVAATGGGEGDLQELGQAFARIKSQGRLSLDVLQSFSSRGVDAIGILGKQFGKTQTEIRDMISGGLVPADKAIDALTIGLKEKFDGATEAVSKNLPGALDRIHAKLRDAGAFITKVFVNPEGGGALVTFLNSMSNSIKTITKGVLPLLQPLLDAMGRALVTVGQKVEQFSTFLADSSGKIKEFASKMSGLLPILAGLLGFLPGMLGFLPVIGPMIAGLGGPFTALIAILGVLAIQSESVRTTLTDMAQSIGGAFEFVKRNVEGFAVAIAGAIGFFGPLIAFAETGTGIFATFAGVISGLVEAIPILGPALANVSGPMGALLGPVAAVALLVGLLIFKSEGFRNAIVSLIGALAPVAALIQDVVAVAIEILTGAFKALEPLIVFAVEVIAGFYRGLAPLIKKIREFIKGIKDSGVIEKVFKGIREAVQFVIRVIKEFINWYNTIPFLPDIVLNVDVKTNGLDEVKKKLHETTIAAVDAAAALRDAANAAAHAAEAAATKVGSLTDSLKQQLQTADQLISPFIEATKKANEARQAVSDAQTASAGVTKEITKIETDRARALQDVITPLNEIAVAERSLTRIRKGLVGLDREELDIAKQLAALRGEEAADDRAGLDRSIERAKISLNQARQAEIDLINESNRATTGSIDVAGMSLDQIKGRLKTIRATLSAQKQASSKKTPQQKADEKTGARLDVVDAEQNLKDVQKARLDFELDTTTKIRDLEERRADIQADRADKVLEEQASLRELASLRKGETTQQALILDFDEKIKDAKEKQKDAAKAVTAAIDASKMASAELMIQTGLITGNVDLQAAGQQEIWRLKGEGAGFDKLSAGYVEAQVTAVKTIITDLAAARAEEARLATEKANSENKAAAAEHASLRAKEAENEALKKAATPAGITAAFWANAATKTAESADLIAKSVKAGLTVGEFILGHKESASFFKEFTVSVTNALKKPTSDQSSVKSLQALIQATGLGQLATSAEQSQTQSSALSSLKNLINPIINGPAGGLKKSGINSVIIGEFQKFFESQGQKFENEDAFKKAIIKILNSLGFNIAESAFFAKGGIVDSPTRAIMGEAGREAILPLTRKFDLARIVNNPAVLPKILDALPRWAMPSSSSEPTIPINSARSIPAIKGSGSVAVDRRKEQSQLAGTIGSAVKSAMIEALSESGGLGADVDINVGSSSNNDILIAREVARQIKKYLGGL